jgi:hypothetical protein
MAVTYIKRGVTVTVEPADHDVVVVTREGSHAPRVDHCPAGDPAGLAAGICRCLVDDGYSLAA